MREFTQKFYNENLTRKLEKNLRYGSVRVYVVWTSSFNTHSSIRMVDVVRVRTNEQCCIFQTAVRYDMQ